MITRRKWGIKRSKNKIRKLICWFEQRLLCFICESLKHSTKKMLENFAIVLRGHAMSIWNIGNTRHQIKKRIILMVCHQY